MSTEEIRPNPAPNSLTPSPTLRYVQDGRGGTIYYSSPETSFKLWYEFALSPALVIIGIPEPRYWVGQTKTPLDQRDYLLTLIGEQVVTDKLSGDAGMLTTLTLS